MLFNIQVGSIIFSQFEIIFLNCEIIHMNYFVHCFFLTENDSKFLTIKENIESSIPIKLCLKAVLNKTVF